MLLRQPTDSELSNVVLLRLHLLLRGDKRKEIEVEQSFDLAESYQPTEQGFHYHHFFSSAFLRNQ